jgi:hypothetical protein
VVSPSELAIEVASLKGCVLLDKLWDVRVKPAMLDRSGLGRQIGRGAMTNRVYALEFDDHWTPTSIPGLYL